MAIIESMSKYITILLIMTTAVFAAFFFTPSTHNGNQASNTSTNKSKTDADKDKVDSVVTVAKKQVVFEPYKKEAFNESLKSDKVAMLFFGANWCSTCALEYGSYTQMAGDYSGNKDLIIYYVHIEDDQISEEDKEVANAHNIISRSSKVLFYNGKKVISTASPWTSQKLIAEINAL
jgi:thiol-disulfide isomerase/thioredoxin